MYFARPNLKTWLRAWFCQNLSAIRIFCFQSHSASRCSITSKTFFYKSPLGAPVTILGGQSWADTALYAHAQCLGLQGLHHWCRRCNSTPKNFIWWKSGKNHLKSGQNLWTFGQNFWKGSQNRCMCFDFIKMAPKMKVQTFFLEVMFFCSFRAS